MKVWIYLDGRQQGPFELEQLLDIPGVNENTKVWFEGLPKWYPAGYLEQMRPLFDGTLAAARVAEPSAEPSEPETTSAAEPETESQAAEQPQQEQLQHQEPQQQPEQRRYAPGQRYVAANPADPCPPTYLGWGVFLLICCCSPIGLAAIVSSVCVSSFYNSGQLDKAKKASEVTAWLIMIAFALGAIPLAIASAIF